MDPRTGEIRHFGGDEEIPDEWVMVPPVDTEVEILFKQRLKSNIRVTRKRRAKVTEVVEGNPGKLVLEMLPNKR